MAYGCHVSSWEVYLIPAAIFGILSNGMQPILHVARVCPCPASYKYLCRSPVKQTAKMSLSAKDKDTVRLFWNKVAGKAGEFGADALYR